MDTGDTDTSLKKKKLEAVILLGVFTLPAVQWQSCKQHQLTDSRQLISWYRLLVEEGCAHQTQGSQLCATMQVVVSDSKSETTSLHEFFLSLILPKKHKWPADALQFCISLFHRKECR